MKTTAQRIQKGFTLIELLVVVAILGILAAAALVALNPAQKISRSKDANDKTALASVVNAINAYYTNNQSYPASLAALQTAGELTTLPTFSSTINYRPNGTTPPSAAVIWFVMGSPTAGTAGTTVWCWDTTMSTPREATTGAPAAGSFVCPTP